MKTLYYKSLLFTNIHNYHTQSSS